MTEISAGKLWGLRRIAGADGVFRLLSADQRPAVRDIIAETRGVDEPPFEDVVAVKQALVNALSGTASATILDPHYGYPGAITRLSPQGGLILTLEDSVFAETPEGRLSKEIDDWSVEKIKRSGADAVKALTWYRPDAYNTVLENQRAFTRRVGEACRRYDIPFILEILVYSFPPDSPGVVDYAKEPEKGTEHLLMAVEEFAHQDYGVDLFMIQSPVEPKRVPDPDTGNAQNVEACRVHFASVSQLANRPWIVMSAGSDRTSLPLVHRYAYEAGANGYVAGRATWWDVFQMFPNMPAMANILEEETAPFLRQLAKSAGAHATPWTKNSAFGPEGPVLSGGGGQDFRALYQDFAED